MWKHLKIGTFRMLNAKSNNLWKLTWEAMKRAFQFLFLQLCIIKISYAYIIWCHFKNNKQKERNIVYISKYK